MTAAAPLLRPDDRPLAAAGWMAGALCCFSATAVAGREAAAELDTFEIMAWRSIAGFAIVVAALAATRSLHQVRARRMQVHLGRNIVHFVGQNLWFFAVTLIPLAQLFAYEFTNPLWVALLAPLVLGERFTRTRLLAAAVGFGGILLVARPWETGGAVAGFGIGQIAALGAAMSFAATTLFTKVLSRTESTASILFFMTLMHTVLGFACAGWDGDIAIPQATLGWIMVISVCGLGAHFCVTTALGIAPASVVAPMEFLRLPLIAVVGAVFYAESLQVAVFLGAAFILGANLMNLRAERRRTG